MLEQLSERFAKILRPRSEAKGVGFSGDFFGPNGTENLIYFNGRGPGVSSGITTETAFAVSAYCYAAIDYLASNVSEAPLRVARLLDDGSHEFVDHPLNELLLEPSADYDMAETLYLTEASVQLYGKSLWIGDDDRLGRTARLMPLTGREFEARQSMDRIYGRFDVTTSRGISAFQPEDVVHFHLLNPYDRWNPLSPTDAALRWLNLGANVEGTVRRSMENGMFPSVVISPHQDWEPTDPEFDRFKSLLDQHYAGPANAGRPFVALGGSKVERVAFSLADMLPDEMLNRIEATVASAYGVAPVILGLLVGLENSPWSQMSEARRMTYEDTIAPIWQKRAAAVTRQLLRPIEPNLELVVMFDTSRITALADNQNAKIDAAQSATTWTLDERRVHAGQEPVGGEEGEWIEAIATFGADDLEEDEGELELEDDVELGGAAPVELKTADLYWYRNDFLSKAFEEAWKEVSEGELGKDARAWEVATQAEDFTRSYDEAIAALDATKGVNESAATLLGMLEPPRNFVARWVAAVTPLVRRTAKASVEILEVTGNNFGLNAYVEREALKLATRLTKTTREEIARLVGKALEEGQSVDALARSIRDSTKFSIERARLIARTETVTLRNGAQREAMSELQADSIGVGIVEKQWLSQRDANVRPEHQRLDGKGAEDRWIPVDDAFANGLQQPGEPNCRCTLIYRVRPAE